MPCLFLDGPLIDSPLPLLSLWWLSSYWARFLPLISSCPCSTLTRTCRRSAPFQLWVSPPFAAPHPAPSSSSCEPPAPCPQPCSHGRLLAASNFIPTVIFTPSCTPSVALPDRYLSLCVPCFLRARTCTTFREPSLEGVLSSHVRS